MFELGFLEDSKQEIVINLSLFPELLSLESNSEKPGLYGSRTKMPSYTFSYTTTPVF